MSDSSDERNNLFEDWQKLLQGFLNAAKLKDLDEDADADEARDKWIAAVHKIRANVFDLRSELRNLDQTNQIPQKWISALRHELRRYNAYTTGKVSQMMKDRTSQSCVELSQLLESSLAKVLLLRGHRAVEPNMDKTADTYTPTDWIHSAHDSIMRALAQCSACHCNVRHDKRPVVVRIAMKTHRQFLESECSVSVFIRAIDSWQETLIEAKKTLADITFRVTENTDSDFSSESYDTLPEPDDEDRIESLCKECQEAIVSIMCLHLVVKCDKADSLFRLDSEPRDWRWMDAISLEHLIERSDLRISPEAKRVLLLHVGYTILHFFNTLWLKDVWNSSKIVFPIKSTGICLTPYLETRPIHITAPSTEETEGTVEHARQPHFLSTHPNPHGHQFPFLVVLAILLLEIHEKQSFVHLARQLKVTMSTNGHDVSLFLDARKVYQRLKEKESGTWTKEDKIFFEAVAACLDKKWWSKVTDEQDMRNRIYKRVIQNLQQYFVACEGKLSEVDKFEDALPLPEDPLRLVEDLYSATSWSSYRVNQPFTQQGLAQLAACDATARLPNTVTVDETLSGQPSLTQLEMSPERQNEMENTETVISRSPVLPAVCRVNVVGSNTRESKILNDQRLIDETHRLPNATARSRLRIRFFDDDSSPQPQGKIDSFGNWKASFIQVYDDFLRSKPKGPKPDDYSSICTKETGRERIKIAVIDTGFDVKHSAFEIAKFPVTEQDPIIRKCCSTCLDTWERCQPEHMQDQIGHGTHIAGIFLDFAKDAELYIIKLELIEGSELNSSHLRKIARALDVVVQDWEVNIISLSFGWQETAAQAYTKDHGEAYTEYKNAIQRASGKALVFAAATNDGPNVGRAWPARESGVFCVHSTDGKGTWSWELNPQKWDPEQSLNLAVVGEAVESYWPCSDPKKLTRMDKMTRSGTSYAAPIAASIAAFLLMFGQKYLDEEQAANLKKFHHMKAVLQAVCRESIAEGHVKPDGFNYLHLSLDSDNFFGKNLDKITEIISNALRGRG